MLSSFRSILDYNIKIGGRKKVRILLAINCRLVAVRFFDVGDATSLSDAR